MYLSFFQSWARDNVTIFSSRKKLLLIALCLYSLWLFYLDTEAVLRWRVVAKLKKTVACPALSLFKSIFCNMRTGLYKFGGPCDIYGSYVSFQFFFFFINIYVGISFFIKYVDCIDLVGPVISAAWWCHCPTPSWWLFGR